MNTRAPDVIVGRERHGKEKRPGGTGPKKKPDESANVRYHARHAFLLVAISIFVRNWTIKGQRVSLIKPRLKPRESESSNLNLNVNLDLNFTPVKCFITEKHVSYCR